MNDTPVTYEDFGAVGDGVADDLPAIVKAHEHANAKGLPVRSRPDATYHLGRQALTVIIATDTDWSTSRFTIDDTEVDNHKASLFEVRSLLEPVEISIDKLERDQKQLDARPSFDCHVRVENSNQRRYIRRGLNQNIGAVQHDSFILRADGSIEGDIDWDYDRVTRVVAQPIDEQTLKVKGGVFTTFANQMKQEVGYNYWSRNIEVMRSNVEVDGLTHYIANETAWGHPYRGFLSARNAADITFRNCFMTGHKIYTTIGSTNKPVSMGSYDLHANDVVNFRLINVRMNHICDRTRWGVIATNFCKNIYLEDCKLSRMDAHMGVSGAYEFRRCELGHMGLNAIGRGVILLEDCTLYGGALVSLRGDYGSTWEGELIIRDCKWIPACGDETTPTLLHATNDGEHDFGYPCYMPRKITIDGLFVDDSNHPANYQGMYLISDPDGNKQIDAERPFPYTLPEEIEITDLETASGINANVSPDPKVAEQIKVSGL